MTERNGMKNGKEVYCSSYCNFGHYVHNGRPIDHECRIIPPKALQAEMEDDFETAINILQNTPKVIVRGRK